MNVSFANDVVESCKSESCLIVGDTIIEMEKKVNPQGDKYLTVNTKAPLLKFLGPEVYDYACYTGDHLKNLLLIIEGLYQNGKKDMASMHDYTRYEVLSHHGFRDYDGYQLNLVLRIKGSSRTHIYSAHIDYCY